MVIYLPLNIICTVSMLSKFLHIIKCQNSAKVISSQVRPGKLQSRKNVRQKKGDIAKKQGTKVVEFSFFCVKLAEFLLIFLSK